MYEAQGAVLLLHAKPSRAIRGVGMFINTSCELILKDLDNLFQDAGGDRDVFLDPRYMLNDQDFDG